MGYSFTLKNIVLHKKMLCFYQLTEHHVDTRYAGAWSDAV